MLETASLIEEDVGLPATYAFRIDGQVTETQMKMLSDRVLKAFDRHDEIDLLLIFDRFEGTETGASVNLPALKARNASLWNVRAYVVASAPEGAAEMIEGVGKLLPVDARTFDTEFDARAWLASLPRLG
ncbi:MAG: STAS/SEC14 domain-containing protein [Paracoccaceae bacterium]|jgi:hypothetical protein|nr:STAS/SEC14 domain-containing protein [Paracoccaceae bacterium]